MLPDGSRPDPRALAVGNFAPDREGHVLRVILNGDSDGTNEGILEFLQAHPPKDYRGKIREPTVRCFTKSAVEAEIIEARRVAGKTVYIPLADGPEFARATPKGLRFRQKVLAAAESDIPGSGVGARPPADFLSYWVPETASHELERGGELDHAASNQYDRIQAGDRVYLVTVWPGGELALLGRILVARRVDQGTAEAVRGRDLWQADWHILARRDTAEPIRAIDLSDVAADLTFESEHRQLTVDRGRVDPRQLQSMRRLTREAAAMLESRLHAARQSERALAEAARSIGQGFGDPETNRQVETRAVSYVTGFYKDRGFRVESREAENLGFDLLCTRAEEEWRVEVKGARGAGPAFTLTENELAAADSDESWQLAIVTEALSEQPQLYLVGGQDLEKYFALRPLAYRGTPRQDPSPLLVRIAQASHPNTEGAFS